ncbi:MAG: hypothetical protein DWQ34_13470 [Planctomycetota bacterium]|nr:MAG: hypothetical protein DWQ29_05615 [Planctomycetota bacterium]REJ92232.1 MAG: hypothetical protein DWQ34_13470 [Planctomycetota bacterium]REK27367.1 MAG: hypothetical protein DWQ41_08370 [Planctomycetota bacterium]REK36611.1 MAG: hypothetical protein DWQ45_08260 [Planctomycetota bacterium]
MPESHTRRRDPHRGRPGLPNELRLLCVSSCEPSWSVLALLLDQQGCGEPQFRWCGSYAAALSLLREETFDCLIAPARIGSRGAAASAASFLTAVEAGGAAEPVLVTTEEIDDELAESLGPFECEILVHGEPWQSPALPVWIGRAIRRAEIGQENIRLTSADRRRSSRERDETETLLDEQRRILTEESRWSAFGESESIDSDRSRLPGQVAEFYQELLRTTVMMGSGNLSEEIRKLAQLLVVAGVGPRTALRIHLEQVEALLKGLGSRSSRHVMIRADVLAMELTLQLGECYRRKSSARGLGDYGIDLLHEDALRRRKNSL